MSGALWSLSGALIARGLGLLASMLVARMLGKEGFGELGIIQSTVGMFGIFAGFGLGMTATKIVAEYRDQDPSKAGRTIALSNLVAVGTGALMTLALLVLAPWLASRTLAAPHLSRLLRIGSGLLLLGAVTGAQTGAMAGFEAFRALALVNLLTGVLAFPLMVGGVWMGGLRGASLGLLLTGVANWAMNRKALQAEMRRAGVTPDIAGADRKLACCGLFPFRPC